MDGNKNQPKTCSKCGFTGDTRLFTSGQNRCKSCTKEWHNEYQQRPDVKSKHRERSRQWYQKPENKVKVKTYRERSGKRDRKEYMRVYFQKNKNKHNKRMKISNQNRNARKQSLPNSLTPSQWEHALNYFNGCCAVCRRQLNDMFGEFNASMDHWIPISYEGDDNPGTVATNIVPLCHGIDGCNNSKSDTLPNEWLNRQFGKRKAKYIAKIVKRYFDSLE